MRFALFLSTLILALALATTPSVAADGLTLGAWLEGRLGSWNQPGSPLPMMAEPSIDLAESGRCHTKARPPTTAEDQALIEAGWTLFGPLQIFADTAVVTAMGAVDGMCRPLAYQAFVFVDGQFAGTLAPRPMSARSDGALVDVRLLGTSSLAADFARYEKDDPLCCPSGKNRVTYEVELGGSPFVIPVDVDIISASD